jgi:methylenetetrahydrofolate reductase (NADPH)
MACSLKALGLGAEPVLQVAARDITRVSFQSQLIGLNSAGIFNILCISGDSPCVGLSPVSNMQMNDLDSVQMLWIARRMRDEGIYLDGRKIVTRPKFFLGAASSPMSGDPAIQALRDQKKVNAGAQFLQTNLVFEPDRLDPWLRELEKRGVADKVYILAGVAALKSLKMAEYLNSKVPGVIVPPAILDRLRKAGDRAAEEGLNIAQEIVAGIKKKKGIHGIHIMTMGWESSVELIVKTL